MIKIPNLQDPIRNFAYEHIIHDIWDIFKDKKPSILDIGSRSSQFPAFLSSLGCSLTAVERMHFNHVQQAIMKAYNTKYIYNQCDLLDMGGKDRFDIITAIYALQHNVDKDIDCYRRCAELAKDCIYIVNEFNYDVEKFQEGRDDGNLRIYSYIDLKERIEKPILEIKKHSQFKYNFMKFDFEKQHCEYIYDIKQANSFILKVII